MLEYDVTITEEDYLKFNIHAALNTKNGKQGLAVLRLLVPCALLIIFALFMPTDFNKLITFMIVCILASIIWILFSKKIYCNGVKTQTKNLKKQGKLPYSEKSKVTFNEDSFCEQADNYQFNYSYNDVEKIYVTDEGIYIYVDLIRAILFPNSCFIEHSKDELIDLLKTKIDKRLFN